MDSQTFRFSQHQCNTHAAILHDERFCSKNDSFCLDTIKQCWKDSANWNKFILWQFCNHKDTWGHTCTHTHTEPLPHFLVWTLACHVPFPCCSVWVDWCCCTSPLSQGTGAAIHTHPSVCVCVCVWHLSVSLMGRPLFLFRHSYKHTHKHHLKCLPFRCWRWALCSDLQGGLALEKSCSISFTPEHEEGKTVWTRSCVHKYTHKWT